MEYLAEKVREPVVVAGPQGSGIVPLQIGNMKNRDLMDDDDIADFRQLMFKNAISMRRFEKVRNPIDNITNRARVNAHGNGAPTGGKYSSLDRHAIVRDIISQRHEAKHQADHDASYRTLGGLELL
jgi:hypothetical protein